VEGGTAKPAGQETGGPNDNLLAISLANREALAVSTPPPPNPSGTDQLCGSVKYCWACDI